jgi:hypothetical protein
LFLKYTLTWREGGCDKRVRYERAPIVNKEREREREYKSEFNREKKCVDERVQESERESMR